MNRSSWTLGTVNLGTPYARAARKHIGDSVIQVATDDADLYGSAVWRSATPLEATTFAPLPKAAIPL